MPPIDSFRHGDADAARAYSVDDSRFRAGGADAAAATSRTAGCTQPQSVSGRINDWLAGPRGSVARRIRRSQVSGQRDMAGLAAYLSGVIESDRVPLVAFAPPLRPTSAFFMALASELNWLLASSVSFLVVTPSRLRHPQQWLTTARVGQQLNASSRAVAIAPRDLAAALPSGEPRLVITQSRWLSLLNASDRRQCKLVGIGGPTPQNAGSLQGDDCWIGVEAY